MCWVLVGTGDNAPLPQDPLPAGGHPDRPAGRPLHHREAGQEQAEAHHPRDGGEAGPRPEGGQIRGVLGPHPGNPRGRTSTP